MRCTLVTLAVAMAMTACADNNRPSPADTTTVRGENQKPMALSVPKQTPNKPQGMPALRAPFSREDVVRYFETHNLPKNSTTPRDFRVESVDSMPSRAVTERLQGVATGVSDDERLVFVTLTGTFVFTGPIKSAPATFKRAYAVFDAQSGNLLMVGSLDQ